MKDDIAVGVEAEVEPHLADAGHDRPHTEAEPCPGSPRPELVRLVPGRTGVDECRGYIQSWWGHAHEIPEPAARRVLRVADQILKAGADQGVRS